MNEVEEVDNQKKQEQEEDGEGPAKLTMSIDLPATRRNPGDDV